MRILLTGRRGQVGWELERALAPLGRVLAHDRGSLDLSDPDAIVRRVSEARPDIIVNAAAYTAVDKAETEPDAAEAINARGPAILAKQARMQGALLVHYSTDYVFDGRKAGAYAERDAPNPLNTYGRSKLAGETAIAESGARYLIFRTSWVYAARGRNFLRTIVKLAGERDTLKVVSDQVGAPTSARFLAEATAHAIRTALKSDVSGLFHLTCSGSTSWHGFAARILAFGAGRIRGADVQPIATSDYPTAAQRPANSCLDCSRFEEAFGLAVSPWERCADLVLEELFESASA